MKSIAVFDFDGTIYKKDTLFSFWFYVLKKHPLRVRFVPIQIVVLLLHALKITSAQTAKQAFLIYLKGLKQEQIKAHLVHFWNREYPHNFNHEVLQYLELYKAQNVSLVCISASPEIFIQSICEKLEISSIIGTKISPNNKGVYKIEGANCRGIEKIDRLYKIFPKDKTEIVFAASDNSDDNQLLALARKSQVIK